MNAGERGGNRRSDVKRRIQIEQRAWLQSLMDATGMKVSQLAKTAGVSDTTLSRIVNDDTYTGALSPLTIERIKGELNVPGPGAASHKLLGFAGVGEAERFNAAKASGTDKAIAAALEALIGDRQGIVPWRLRTEALLAIGLWPGDLVLVDPNVDPKPQDAVCVTVQDWARGGSDTIFRVFDPPFLVAAASARDRTMFKPILVDNERVQIRGVIVESLRPRQVR